MIVCGDFGIPFGINGPYFSKKEDIYKAKWLNSQKYTTVAICGNHDDRDAIAEMPIIEKWGGQVRQLQFCGQTFDKIFYVDTPQILDVNGCHLLIIPGAESHDIDDGILDPFDPQFDIIYNKWKKDWSKMFRVNHWSWWETEAIDIPKAEELIVNHIDEHFDMILTHDCPALFFRIYTRGFSEKPTEGELLLDNLREVADFNVMCHGHMHVNLHYREKEYIEIPVGNDIEKRLLYDGDPRVWGLYEHIYEYKDGGLDYL